MKFRLVILVAMLISCVVQLGLVTTNLSLLHRQHDTMARLEKAKQALDTADQKYLADLTKNVDYTHYSIIHRPASGCPPGWQAVDDLFTERSGVKLPGCWDADKLKHGDILLDFLLAGESVAIPALMPGMAGTDGSNKS